MTVLCLRLCPRKSIQLVDFLPGAISQLGLIKVEIFLSHRNFAVHTKNEYITYGGTQN